MWPTLVTLTELHRLVLIWPGLIPLYKGLAMSDQVFQNGDLWKITRFLPVSSLNPLIQCLAKASLLLVPQYKHRIWVKWMTQQLFVYNTYKKSLFIGMFNSSKGSLSNLSLYASPLGSTEPLYNFEVTWQQKQHCGRPVLLFILLLLQFYIVKTK